MSNRNVIPFFDERGSTVVLLGGMLLGLAGCSQPTGTPEKPAGTVVLNPDPVEENDSILQPQSEPLVDSNDAEEPATEEASSPESATPQSTPEPATPEPAEPSQSETPQAEPESPAEPKPESAEEKQETEADSAKAAAGKIYVLFDGDSLENWKISNFGGEGPVEVKDGTIVMERGQDMTGIHWVGEPLPKINYEVSLEAKRIDGSDFFCGIIFPVNDAFCSFVAGGWGGSVVGLSSINDVFAAENETGTYAVFKDDTWYKFRLRVSEHAITAWIDGKEYVHLMTKDRKLSLHPAVEPAKPFGVSCYATVAGVKDIVLRELTAEEVAADAKSDEE